MVNPLLQSYVSQKMAQPTVILSCRILIANHMIHGVNATMSKTEIETEFNQVHQQYGIATFRRDYVLRQCGHDENGITQTDNRFHIRPEFLEGMSHDDYVQILQTIDNHWGTFQTQQEQIITEIRTLLNRNDYSAQRQYVTDMMTNREAIKRGQAFEVASFSVLYTYLGSLGFTLNRYSTTYSNDGGIDFVAQNAVYQVTTKLSERKFEEDIKKVPGKLRVLIYKDLVRDFDPNNFNHELVSNYLSKEELCNLLSYLYEKNARKYLPEVLTTMMQEFMREFYQNEEEIPN
jgi:hypothetical protein